MLFATIRLLFFITFLIIGFVLTVKLKITHKYLRLIGVFAISVILTTIFALIPIENLLITFPSPESAYNYNNYGKVKLIVEGNKTDFVVATKRDTDSYVIIPRAKDGWKIGMGLSTKRINQVLSDSILIKVYQYKNSNEYFITVLDTNGGQSDISDNQKSDFKYKEEYNKTLDKKYYTYYAYISDFNDRYVLTVNGDAIKLLN